MPHILTVSQLNTYVKMLLEENAVTANLFVSGEISNFSNHYSTGHFYLTLKDQASVIKAVMFRSYARRLRFTPENGMRVLCRGRVSLFERDGQYQLYIEDMQPDGVGALSVAYEQLKNRLQKEGLFDKSLKKPLPAYPETVAVITSDTGAAVQDICNILTRRYPLCRVVICPVQVQGDTAAGQIADMLHQVNTRGLADVIILGRGGGSIEDLAAFNDEGLARAVRASGIPVISAVGHETDYTICDFAADLRAPTPSAAAELCVPDSAEVLDKIIRLKIHLKQFAQIKIQQSENRLSELLMRQCLQNPGYRLEEMRQRLDFAVRDLKMNFEAIVSSAGRRCEYTVLALESLSPLQVLSRGYAIARKDRKTLQTVNDLKEGMTFELRLQDGAAECKVCATQTETPIQG